MTGKARSGAYLKQAGSSESQDKDLAQEGP